MVIPRYFFLPERNKHITRVRPEKRKNETKESFQKRKGIAPLPQIPDREEQDAIIAQVVRHQLQGLLSQPEGWNVMKRRNTDDPIKLTGKLQLSNILFDELLLGVFFLRNLQELRTKINAGIVHLFTLFLEKSKKTSVSTAKLKDTSPLRDKILKKMKLRPVMRAGRRKITGDGAIALSELVLDADWGKIVHAAITVLILSEKNACRKRKRRIMKLALRSNQSYHNRCLFFISHENV